MEHGVDPRLNLAATLVDGAKARLLAALTRHDRQARAKGPGDVVTKTDLDIESYLRREIAGHFPEDTVFGEETGGHASPIGFTWLIDPVDGTVNFARHLDYSCISVALLRGGLPIAAWICDARHDELFWAGPDRKVFVNTRQAACSAPAGPADAVIGLGFSTRHDPSLAARIVNDVISAGMEFRRLGAGALSLAHVAAGRLDAYLEPHMQPWDAVGGLYLAACSGAVTLDYRARDGLTHGAAVFAAAPSIAPALLACLPEPFSDTPPHLEDDLRSAGEAAIRSHPQNQRRQHR